MPLGKKNYKHRNRCSVAHSSLPGVPKGSGMKWEHSFSEFQLGYITYSEYETRCSIFSTHGKEGVLPSNAWNSTSILLGWVTVPSETVLISALYDGCGKVYFQFFFFFFLSKRNIMTSTCPPLPLQHILREVHVFTENMFKASLPVAPARSSQSALQVPERQEVPLSRADILMYLSPPGDCELLKVGIILLHLNNPCV